MDTRAQSREESLVERIFTGDIGALARVITLVENESAMAPRLLALLQKRAGQAQVCGITGPPGAGKSTLVQVLASELRKAGNRVAIVAIDPSSPFTGGALLGDLTFIGGLQVDPYGNTNMIGLKRAGGGFRIRGPGTVGIATLTAHIRRYFIFLNDHSPRVFAPECDFISSVGWAGGGADARQRLGLSGGGPQFVITPRCVMDFDPGTKHMRLRYLLPGVDIDEVRANTGFPLPLAPKVEELPTPTERELSILRGRVDPGGILRSAAKRARGTDRDNDPADTSRERNAS
jgi:energy-coupling factor transporter ATP-binding protein EcfA2